MSMLRTCSSPGCETLTLGELCLEHELVSAALAPAPRRRVFDPTREPVAPAAAQVPDEEAEVARG